MKIDKWLYFRNVNDEDNDDGDTGSAGHNPSSICIPASAVQSMSPASASSIKIKFKNLKLEEEQQVGKRRNYDGDDNLNINCTAGKAFEVMEALSQAISNDSNTDGFIVVADDVTTNYDNKAVKGEYFHPHITSCGTIEVYDQHRGTGIHEYYEEIQCNPNADADQEVVGSLSIKLPNQCILLEGGITALSLSDHADSSVALKFHSAAVADLADATSTGTEYIGAGAANVGVGADDGEIPHTSIPNADLLCGSGDVQFDTVHSGTHPPVDRDAADTHFFLVACEDASGATTNAKVGVYIKWFGAPAVTIAD